MLFSSSAVDRCEYRLEITAKLVAVEPTATLQMSAFHAKRHLRWWRNALCRFARGPGAPGREYTLERRRAVDGLTSREEELFEALAEPRRFSNEVAGAWRDKPLRVQRCGKRVADPLQPGRVITRDDQRRDAGVP